jgi:hypothetical protein
MQESCYVPRTLSRYCIIDRALCMTVIIGTSIPAYLLL